MDVDDEQSEQLSEIHAEVEGTHIQLGKIDERTRNIEAHLNSISEDVSENEAELQEMRSKVKRNTTITTGVAGGISMILLWFSDKITRLF